MEAPGVLRLRESDGQVHSLGRQLEPRYCLSQFSGIFMPSPANKPAARSSLFVPKSFIGQSELPQKPQIIFVEQPDIIDAITNHGDAFDAEAKGPAGPHFRIVADVFEHPRMHHSTAGDLEPVLANLPPP